MKRIVAILICIFFFSLNSFASTINWELYSKDHKYKVVLKGTTWVSTRDGEKIYFDAEDGDGHFENGKSFGYRPQIYHVNGMSIAPETPEFYELSNEIKMFNTIRLVVIKGKKYLVDKRGIKYYQK